MKFLDYVGRAISVFTPIGKWVAGKLRVTTTCVDCGAIHIMVVQVPCKLRVDKMMHQSWCSLDMRNIRRTFTVVRR